MKVFSDLHHSGLFYSLHLLFEKRLGWELYRPIGMEWFPQWWNIARPYNNDINTANQYLSFRDIIPADGSPVLNNVKIKKDKYFEVEEQEHGYTQKAITLDQFKEMDIDIIVASIPDHWETYRKLRDKYKPKAKLICQMGNMFNEVKIAKIDNLMSSTIEFPTDSHSVFYHQEIPIIPYKPPITQNVNSFVHLLPEPQIYNKFKKALPEFNFKAYGASTTDGWVSKLSNVYREMQNSLWGFHHKPRGDGFGWVIHSWFMIGRPVIVNYSDYKDKLAGQLMIPDENCIDINDPKAIEKIKVAHPTEMGKRAREKFLSVVNYDEEEIELRHFLDNLK